DRARRRAEIGADLVAERDLHSGLALVVPQMRRELVTDAVADRVDVIGRAERVVDFQDVAAVVRDPRGVEAKGRERGRGGAPDVELDDRGLDRRAVRELHDVLATLSGTRPDALGTRVLAHVHSIAAKRLREQRGASRMVGRIDLPRAHQGRAHAEARVDLRELRPRRPRAEDGDALRELAEARAFFVRPEAGLVQAVDLRHLRDRTNRDDEIARLDLARIAIGAYNDPPPPRDLRVAADRGCPRSLVPLDVPRVVGIVAALADDHVVAPRRCSLPGIVTAAGADLRR